MRALALQHLAICTLASVVALLARGAASQSEFVGTIHYDVVNKGKHIELVLATDGRRLREDIVPRDSIAAAHAYAMIVDARTGQLTVLMPLTHQYRVMPFASNDPARDAPVPPLAQALRPTGRHERVLGTDCELFLSGGGGGIAPDEYCMTTALGRVTPLDSLYAHGDSSTLAAPLVRLLRGGGLMLRMRWNSADPPVTTIASRIDRTAPSPSIFAVPADYERAPLRH